MSTYLQIFITIDLRRENARHDAEYKASDQYTIQERAAEREKSDNTTFFRCTV